MLPEHRWLLSTLWNLRLLGHQWLLSDLSVLWTQTLLGFPQGQWPLSDLSTLWNLRLLGHQ